MVQKERKRKGTDDVSSPGVKEWTYSRDGVGESTLKRQGMVKKERKKDELILHKTTKQMVV